MSRFIHSQLSLAVLLVSTGVFCPRALVMGAEQEKLVALRMSSEMRADCVKFLTDADQKAERYLAQAEQTFRGQLRQARSKERLKAFVQEILGFMQKIQMGQDFFNNSSDSETRIRTLFRKQILNDEEFARLAGDFIDQFNRFLAEQDSAMLVRFKTDRNVPAQQLSRGQLSTDKFRKQIESIISSSVSAAQADVARFAATFVATEAISSAAKDVGRSTGLLPNDESLFGQITGFVVELVIGAAVDQLTDPTDEIVRSFERQLAAAETTILDGTDQQPGLFRMLRKAKHDRTDARIRLLNERFR